MTLILKMIIEFGYFQIDIRYNLIFFNLTFFDVKLRVFITKNASLSRSICPILSGIQKLNFKIVIAYLTIYNSTGKLKIWLSIIGCKRDPQDFSNLLYRLMGLRMLYTKRLGSTLSFCAND